MPCSSVEHSCCFRVNIFMSCQSVNQMFQYCVVCLSPPLTPPSHLQQLQVVVVFGGGEAGEGGTIDIAHGRRRLLACVEGVAVEALGTAPSLLERRATFDDLRIGHGQHVHVVDRIRLQLKRGGMCVCVW